MKNGRYIEDGMKCWYEDDLLHRLDGPAVIYRNGQQEWWVDGERHRLDGPAVIDADGSQYWYVDGRNVTAAHLSVLGITDYPGDGFTDQQLDMLRILL